MNANLKPRDNGLGGLAVFRADQVGSFLRPKVLLDARGQAAKGEITPEQLRAVEDKAIAEVVKFQEDVGLQSITDGEFRREYFHIDFLKQLGGVNTESPVSVIGPDGKEHLSPPTMLHFRGGRAGISSKHYPDLEQFYQDVADAYGAELRSLAAAGCTSVQMDDTNLAYLCDDGMREAARKRGDDPNELPHRYASFVNRVVAQKPAGMTLSMHLCRGNFKSTWAAQGGYEPVAEALLSKMDIDAYFLEYDDQRSGDFKPLRFLPKGKIVVLGLITTKLGSLEDKDAIKRRIDEAAQYAPLEQLALSPQCGFSSTVHGNDIAVEQQAQKLRLVIEIAREVWGES